jgi:RNA polymerase sigma factor (sigma-70 family)
MIRDWAERSLMASVLETMSAAPSEAERREMIASRNARVMANQRLVAGIATEFRDRGVDMEDLIQFGNVGLIVAAERFNPSLGFRFSTYASYWIRCMIRRGFHETSKPIRLPESASRMASAFSRRREVMTKDRGTVPLVSEVLDEMVSSGDAEPGQRGWIASAVKLNETTFSASPEGWTSFACPICPDPSRPTVDDANRDRLAAAMLRLVETKRDILTMRYGLDGSHPIGVRGVSARTGIPWTTVKRLEREAVVELKRLIENPECPPFTKGRS